MATFSYTHSYDGLYRFVLIIAIFCVMFLVWTALLELPDQLVGWMPEWARVIGGIVAVFTSMAYTPVVLEKTIWPWWVPTWLYARLSLGVPISKKEADQITFLFDGSLGGVWYPLNGIRSVDKEFRREALFRFVNHLCRQNRWRILFPEFDETRNRQQARTDAGEKRATSKPEKIIDESREAAASLLGLKNIAFSPEELKKAYRRKISQFHPDRFTADRPEVRQYAEEMSKKLNLAYEYLLKNG